MQLAPIGAEYIRSCLCSALLPPCPDPVASNCVPLATITIRKRDCKIMRVCNWSARKFATTFPNLQYWFSFLPFTRLLREAIETVCCRPFRGLEGGQFSASARTDRRFTAFRRSAMEINPEQEFSRVVLDAIRNRDRVIDAQTLFLGAMEFQDDKQRPLMTDAELRNPLQYLLLNQLAAPLIQNAVPEETAEPLKTAFANFSRIVERRRKLPTADVQDAEKPGRGIEASGPGSAGAYRRVTTALRQPLNGGSPCRRIRRSGRNFLKSSTSAPPT